MGQWNTCQGLGALVRVVGIPPIATLVCPRTDAQAPAPLPLPFCRHAPWGLGVWGRFELGMNPVCPVVGQGCKVFILPRKCNVKETDGKHKEEAFSQLCEQEVSIFILHCLANYVAGPVCYTRVFLISPLLSGCFLEKCVDRINITYFPCCLSLMQLRAFVGFFTDGIHSSTRALMTLSYKDHCFECSRADTIGLICSR